ncbi:uncharacterized protein J8A68_001888 [[Candida] subhashii]|uniref:Galactose oxidase n=1 Tax=[Candida] subhashii TaxID=561895 RepID=A0A8J5UJJ0_9ASCO|nr:uncharacterized protein J8A68_001888 [[Candida] subhashii]KAG7664593.1 hypothetical protein J8A68_001888 [[Candida] subhashii]
MTELESTWNTLYDYESGKIYVHLKNNGLLRLNFSITGFDDVDKDSLQYFNLNNNQEIDTLTPPPEYSTLFILNQGLYALTSKTGDDQDLCGDGTISIIKFQENKNKWTSPISLNTNNISDGSFYRYPTIFTNPEDTTTIYIYGGICDKSGSISSRMLSIDFSSNKANSILTSTQPQPFYGAANLLAPNPQAQLVIGGESSNGWLNMCQLATWDFHSGWSSKQIKLADASETLNSRKFALALPIFDPLKNKKLLYNDFMLKEVLLIGGESGDGDKRMAATPEFVKLSLDSTNWSWDTNVTNGINGDEILGAATIFDTLVVINSTSTNRKRDDSYKINLWDTGSFKPVTSLKGNTKSLTSSSSDDSSSSSSSSGVNNKIIFGTVFPLGFMSIIIGVLIVYLIKRRNKNKLSPDERAYNEIDYKYEDIHSSSFIVEPQLYASDANSTLESASIDSWMKKRQDFEKIRHSYLASNETLSTDSDAPMMGRRQRDFAGERVVDDEDEEDREENSGGSSSTSEFDVTSLSVPQAAVMNKSIKTLTKSFSFTDTPSTPLSKKFKRLPNGNKLEYLSLSTRSKFRSPHERERKIEGLSDTTSLDEQVDVQVLVSSKRRSVLRVVNPDSRKASDATELAEDDDNENKPLNARETAEGDEHTMDDTWEDEFDFTSSTSSLRQRIPSGQK